MAICISNIFNASLKKETLPSCVCCVYCCTKGDPFRQFSSMLDLSYIKG